MPIISGSTSPMTPSLQLLVLLSRLELSDEQEKSALALCQRIYDWSDVSRQAQQRFVLPLVYRHLRRLSPETLTQEQLGTMKRQCMFIVQHNLRVISAQCRLVKELLNPLGIPHVFFKGPALAACYYDEPAMRFCRDIDLLVPHDHAVELLAAALEQGFMPYNPEHLAADRISLEFATRTQSVITLISPEGITVEIHQHIDCACSIYDTEDLVANAVSQRMGDVQVPVMPTAELFVYICMHHTRHHWSHLHWLVDLDAIQRHPSFDLDAVYACATRRNLMATMEASLELHRALAMPGCVPDIASLSPHGRDVLETCLTALQGDHEVELALRRQNLMPDFAFAWQVSDARRRHRQWLGWTRLFQPVYADYRIIPLPPRWQWIYHIMCPFRKAVMRLKDAESR